MSAIVNDNNDDCSNMNVYYKIFKYVASGIVGFVSTTMMVLIADPKFASLFNIDRHLIDIQSINRNKGLTENGIYNIINRVFISIIVLINNILPQLFNQYSKYILVFSLTVFLTNILAIASGYRYNITQKEIDKHYLNEKFVTDNAYKVLLLITNITVIIEIIIANL